VRVLCLFSNGLEDPGVISSENGKWPSVPDHQLEFLEAQIQKIKDEVKGRPSSPCTTRPSATPS
jgi:hypothetical protein